MSNTIVELERYAVLVAMRSPCQSKRGAVIFDADREVVSQGHNHLPSPFVCDGSDACKRNCGKSAVHAEEMAIVRAQRKLLLRCDIMHVKAVDGAAVASGCPSCPRCSALILEVGIAGVWLLHADGWKRYDSADFHYQSTFAAGCGYHLPFPVVTK